MSGRRFTLDTNILVYAVDRSAGQRHLVAEALIVRAAERDCRLTLQAVSEFYAAVTRKGIVPAWDAAMIAADWMELFPCAAASAETVRLALDAAAAGCAAMLTEDLADGGTLFGMRIVNPFGADWVAAAEVPRGGRLSAPRIPLMALLPLKLESSVSSHVALWVNWRSSVIQPP